MKKCVLAGAFVALMAVAAQAQVTFQYTRRTSNSSLTITASSGYYYGYGGSSTFGPGLVGSAGGGTYAFGVRHVFPSDFGYTGGYGGYGYGFPDTYVPGSYYTGGGLYSYGTPPGLYGGRAFVRRTPVNDFYPGPLRAGPAPEKGAEYASAREIEEGRRRFRAGDYRGALDEFRAAVAAHTESPLAQAHFALALAVTGDHKNADKSLRGAADHVLGGKVDLKAMFRDDKERARVQGLLAKAPDGSLTAAWALSLLGDADRLKKLAEKDVAAKNLLAQ